MDMKRQTISEATKEAMRLYKAEGHSNSEVAEKFNINYQTTKAICRGIARQTIESAEEPFLEGFRKKFGKSVVVIGEYTGIDDKIAVKSLVCGHTWNWPCGNLRKGRKCDCPICKDKTKRKRLAEEEKAKAEAKERRAKEQQKRAIAKQRAKEEKLKARLHKCPVCGKETTRKVYCSNKCAKRVSNKTGEIKRRVKIQKQLVDRGITLEKLYKRDKGICWLCGLECNKNDYERIDKTFIAGNFYPSIDHVKPLSKGGLHSWDNVRLAHRICNTKKNDKII